MWPKALLQLIQLAPHVTRLVPVANRYLQTRTDGGESGRRAVDGLRGELAQTAERMHGDLTRVSGAQAATAEQLTQQGKMLESIAADLDAARLAGNAIDARMARMETRMSRLWTTLLAGLLLIFVVGVILIFVMLHAR
jgi:hypothetical protein